MAGQFVEPLEDRWVTVFMMFPNAPAYTKELRYVSYPLFVQFRDFNTKMRGVPTVAYWTRDQDANRYFKDWVQYLNDHED